MCKTDNGVVSCEPGTPPLKKRDEHTTPEKGQRENALLRNFRPGDKIFGLHEKRVTYFDQLRQNNPTVVFYREEIDEPGKEYYATIDLINDQIEGNQINPNTSVLVTSYSHHLKSRERSANKQIFGCDNSLFRRRACKAALYYTDFPTIHFLLDGIEDRRVLTKKYYNKAKDGTERYIQDDSYTGHELRHIAKNWNLLKGRIIFYLDGKVQETPQWISDADKRAMLIDVFNDTQILHAEEKRTAAERTERLGSWENGKRQREKEEIQPWIPSKKMRK